jgi:hypothetical protein
MPIFCSKDAIFEALVPLKTLHERIDIYGTAVHSKQLTVRRVD